MKNRISKVSTLGLVLSPFVLIYPLHSQEVKRDTYVNEEITFEINRLSERVLVLANVSPNGIVTAISTVEGIIIIDTGISWSFGKRFRKIIEDEFKSNEFVYVINTHADRDHTFGNQIFNDAPIIGHENSYTALQRLKKEWDEKKNEYISLHTNRADSELQAMKEAPEDSDLVVKKRRSIAINKLIASDLSEGQVVIPPTLTFKKQSTLYAGEITLHLYYMGEGHSDCDILIHVPEENLVIAGDAFIQGMLICYLKQDKFDLSRYSEVINKILNTSTPVKFVVCGHGSIMTADELLIRRDYLFDLMQGIKEGYIHGLDMETIIGRFPLDNYSNLTRFFGEVSAELINQHTEIIEKYWNFLQDEGRDEP